MPSYDNDNFKQSNINYLNKDFSQIRQSLVDYAKSYFPDTYRDFNETSPGMMLMEMNAYVGDVLSFYIVQQYREMLLPLAEERRNILNMAKMFGYKVKPIVPSVVNLTFKSEVNAVSSDPSKIDYSDAGVFDKGIKVTSANNTGTIFETLDVVDFTISGSNDTAEVRSSNAGTGVIETYTLSRTVRAVSGETKTKTFTVNEPQKFLKLTIPDKNVIDILSCYDANGNEWHEVDFLAQDKVPIKTHYTEKINRDTAYFNLDGSQIVSDVPVPYSLEYIVTSKRFTRETNADNTTSVIFGNGVLRQGKTIDDGFIDLQQVGITVPGQTNDLTEAIDPLLGNEYSTLGETPNQTTLTITYRVGGGIESNVVAGDLSSFDTATVSNLSNGNITATLLNVNNSEPSSGGKSEETIDELRQNIQAFFRTQNRCVTKEDYEARVLNLPSNFGSIAKVFVARNALDYLDTLAIQTQVDDVVNPISTTFNTIDTDLDNRVQLMNQDFNEGTLLQNWVDHTQTAGDSSLGGVQMRMKGIRSGLSNLSSLDINFDVNFGNIRVYLLSYDKNKQLVGNPNNDKTGTKTDNVPLILKQNIKNYLENFRILTDDVMIQDGYIINFGVFFDVVSHKYANKQEVRLLCIQAIKDYFKIDKMQFSQPLFVSQLEYDLMNIDGVRAVNYVRLSQKDNIDSVTGESVGEPLESQTYKYSINSDGTLNVLGNSDDYGYYYDFQSALKNGVILPPSPSNPGVFELKHPNKNIKGVVR